MKYLIPDIMVFHDIEFLPELPWPFIAMHSDCNYCQLLGVEAFSGFC